jgi:hypothetical protein
VADFNRDGDPDLAVSNVNLSGAVASAETGPRAARLVS